MFETDFLKQHTYIILHCWRININLYVYHFNFPVTDVNYYEQQKMIAN